MQAVSSSTQARNISVQGVVEGDIIVGPGQFLEVTEGARVNGDIILDESAGALIRGYVDGDVVGGGAVTVSEGAVVNGNISQSA